jgi:hypothetical protein
MPTIRIVVVAAIGRGPPAGHNHINDFRQLGADSRAILNRVTADQVRSREAVHICEPDRRSHAGMRINELERVRPNLNAGRGRLGDCTAAAPAPGNAREKSRRPARHRRRLVGCGALARQVSGERPPVSAPAIPCGRRPRPRGWLPCTAQQPGYRRPQLRLPPESWSRRSGWRRGRQHQ